jgi:hypothetical protein
MVLELIAAYYSGIKFRISFVIICFLDHVLTKKYRHFLIKIRSFITKDYILKPIVPEILQARVQEYLED